MRLQVSRFAVLFCGTASGRTEVFGHETPCLGVHRLVQGAIPRQDRLEVAGSAEDCRGEVGQIASIEQCAANDNAGVADQSWIELFSQAKSHVVQDVANFISNAFVIASAPNTSNVGRLLSLELPHQMWGA